MLKTCAGCGEMFDPEGKPYKYCYDCRVSRQAEQSNAQGRHDSARAECYHGQLCLLCGQRFNAKKWNDTLCEDCKLKVQRSRDDQR